MGRATIRDEGSLGAKIVLIGEAPGEREEAQGRPFVGPSGAKLAAWWQAAGLARHDLFITNVLPWRPPRNDFSTVTAAELEHAVQVLHTKLASLTDPVVLVPTGGVALHALLGKGSITKYRGSILPYVDQAGRTLKVIPTIHPAAVFRTMAWEGRCRRDWVRIASDRRFKDLRTPERTHVIRPVWDDLQAFYADVQEYAGVLALDIETPRPTWRTQVGTFKNGSPKYTTERGDPAISCVGLSWRPAEALCVPTTVAFWGSEKKVAAVWDWLRLLLALPVPKVTHNGLFDWYYLGQDHGLEPKGWWWDTLALHHALEPTEDHDLAFCASVDTREPYWKDEAKDPDEVAKYQSNLDAFWSYNCKDAAVTCELAGVYQERLEQAQRFPFYSAHYRDLFLPLLSLMRGGVRVDDIRRRLRHNRLLADCVGLQDELTTIAGEPLYGKKDLSGVKLKKFLYETLRVPTQYAKNAKGLLTATVKEVAVRKLMLALPSHETLQAAGTRILTHRRKAKLATFYADTTTDADHRVRCSYKFAPETGRLSSAKNPKRTGMNLQNVDREARDHFLPDPGHLWMEVDLSQAESRVVGMLTRDPALVQLAQTPPWEVDVHRQNAALIFGIAEGDVTKEQRYLGKRAIHASNYGMKGKKLAEELLKDGYVLTAEQCQGMVDAYLDAHPGIRKWQRETRQEIIRTRTLTNSWGRRIVYEYDRLDDDLYRRAYAFVPQSEVADLLNQWGLVPTWRWLRRAQMASRILTQVHDSLGLSVAPAEAWGVWEIIQASLERPRSYRGLELTIPVDLKLGARQTCTVEFSRPPTREAFEADVAGLPLAA